VIVAGMTTTQAPAGMAARGRQLLNKVPEVTLYFWVIKILATTVGETAADFLNTTLGFGLNGTSVVMAAVLVAVLVVQFRTPGYVPGVYWLTVVLISVVGTLVTDNLTDNLGVSLEVATSVFAVALLATFAAWFASERTLSIHTIVTTRREGFYWATILFTFALGTAAGDLLATKLDQGFLIPAGIFAAAIAATVVLWRFGVDAVATFWIAYVLTRPLGASLGDYLSQDPDAGGLGLGTTVTSAIFLAVILTLVVFLTRTRKDATPPVPA